MMKEKTNCNTEINKHSPSYISSSTNIGEEQDSFECNSIKSENGFKSAFPLLFIPENIVNAKLCKSCQLNILPKHIAADCKSCKLHQHISDSDIKYKIGDWKCTECSLLEFFDAIDENLEENLPDNDTKILHTDTLSLNNSNGTTFSNSKSNINDDKVDKPVKLSTDINSEIKTNTLVSNVDHLLKVSKDNIESKPSRSKNPENSIELKEKILELSNLKVDELSKLPLNENIENETLSKNSIDNEEYNHIEVKVNEDNDLNAVQLDKSFENITATERLNDNTEYSNKCIGIKSTEEISSETKKVEASDLKVNKIVEDKVEANNITSSNNLFDNRVKEINIDCDSTAHFEVNILTDKLSDHQVNISGEIKNGDTTSSKNPFDNLKHANTEVKENKNYNEKKDLYINQDFSQNSIGNSTSNSAEINDKINDNKAKPHFFEDELTKIKYISLERGTIFNNPKLIDSLGYTYNIRKVESTYISWQCSLCSGNTKCRSCLFQVGNYFKVKVDHNHKGNMENYFQALRQKEIERSPLVLTKSHIDGLKKGTSKKSNKRKLNSEIVKSMNYLPKSTLLNKKKVVSAPQSYRKRGSYILMQNDTLDEPILRDLHQGYSYILKSAGKTKVWICAQYLTHYKCAASVNQVGNCYVKTRDKHVHSVSKKELAETKEAILGSKKTYTIKKSLSSQVSKQKFEQNRISKNVTPKTEEAAIMKLTNKKSFIKQSANNSRNEKNNSYSNETAELESLETAEKTIYRDNKKNGTFKNKISEGEKKMERESMGENFSNVNEVNESLRSKINTSFTNNKTDLQKNNVRTKISITEEQKLGLVKIFMNIINTGYPVRTNVSVKRNIMKLFIEAANLYFTKLNLVNNNPTSTWVKNFLENDSNLNRKLEDSSKMSYSAVNWSKFHWFYSRFEASLKVNYRQEAAKYLVKSNARRIFSCDTIELPINMTSKDEENTNKGYQREMTVLCCVNCAGDFIKPLIINKGYSLAKYADNKDIVGRYNSAFSLTGKLTTDIFHNWLQLFDNELVAKLVPRPVILIMNGYHACISYESINYAGNRNIFLYFVPPYTSKYLSPINISLFPSLSKNFALRFNKLQNKILCRKYFPDIFFNAYQDVDVEAVVKGFETAGLCPYNPNANLVKAKKSLTKAESTSTIKREILDHSSFYSPHKSSAIKTKIKQEKVTPLKNDKPIKVETNVSPLNEKTRLKRKSDLTNKTSPAKKLRRIFKKDDDSRKILKIELKKNIKVEKASPKSKSLPKTNDKELEEISFPLNLENSHSNQITTESLGAITHVNNEQSSDINNELTTEYNVSPSLNNKLIEPSSERIGYQKALYDVENIFNVTLEPSLLNMYKEKLASDVNYSDTLYILWRGLQRLKSNSTK